METKRYHIAKKVLAVLPFYLFAFLPLSAQTFTERVQRQAQGQGTVTIHQSAEIDQLVNDPNATGVQKKTEPTPVKPNGNDTASRTNAAQNTKPTEGTDNAAAATDVQKKPARGTHKVMGYRVQAFAGGNSRRDRQMAEQTRNNIKAQHPGVAVYVHFFSPRWICRVGNYRTYEEAHQMMITLQRSGYRQASVVKDKVSVAY